MEENNIIEDNFFIIDSNNLNSIESKFYGYTIYNNEIITSKEFNKDIKLEGDGAYIDISKDNNQIIISQDFFGSYGLYLYEYNNIFVISNSFLKLVEYLKDKYPISLNEDCAKSFIAADLCAISYKSTMINEIQIIPRNYILKININSKKLDFEKIDYKEDTIEVNSKEGIETLDNWVDKWVKIIRKLFEKKHYLNIDLSGGFDSRLTLLLVLRSNIDLNQIEVSSINDNLHTHKEDFEIASSISKYYNFKLNRKLYPSTTSFKSIKTPIDISFYSKLCFHKQMYYDLRYYKDQTFKIGGLGGECIREYWIDNPKEYIDKCLKRASNYSEELKIPTKNILEKSFEELQKDYNIKDQNLPILTTLLYKEVRTRNHHSKSIVENLLSNYYIIVPLMDKELYKLNRFNENIEDDNLLITLIFTRYCPKLLDFKFEGRRSINKETIKFAKKINEKYPLKLEKPEFLSKTNEQMKNLTNKNLTKSNNSITYNSINKYIKEVFSSNSFENTFEIYFSKKLYHNILKYVNNHDYFPLQPVISSIGVLKIINDVDFNKNKFNNNIFDWLNHFIQIPNQNRIKNEIFNQILPYNIARIDIKNMNNDENNIDIINISDKLSKINSPEWFNDDEGKGYVIESSINNVSIKFKCINDGKLNITLRSKDIRDKLNQHFPIYIDYISFIVNGEEQLNKNQLISHDKPLKYYKDVKNGEIIEVTLKWLPFNTNSEYKSDITQLKNEINELKSENKLLKNSINSLQEENEIMKTKSYMIKNLFKI